MRHTLLLTTCILFTATLLAQPPIGYKIPTMPDTAARMATLRREWKAINQSPPQLGVRDCFLFLADALDTRMLKEEEIVWLLKKLQTRMVHDPSAGRSYGNIFWGWHETGNDVGDGNNVEFCLQYGMIIKLFFNDRLSAEARELLDRIFALGIKGCRNQEVRISYTNIYLMKIWNFIAYGEVYKDEAILNEGRGYLDLWLKHVARYGNREYDSPTYCGVDLESLLLLHTFTTHPDIKNKIADVLQFFLTDLSSHYNAAGGYLAGAHSRDYNRVFGRDLLEEKYFNPLLGTKSTNTHLFHEVCLTALRKIGLSAQQKELMQRKNRFIVQRWDSLPHTYACDYTGNKVSLASSNQAYSPDDKPFVAYLFSKKIPAMPNIAYVMEGRDDHYGTWAAEGMGEKMKHLMPPNYPSNGGWGKARHLMPFMQSAQNRGEMVMLVSGERDHNCITPYLNSTILLPDNFDEMWMNDWKITHPAKGGQVEMNADGTFFARFEDVVIAFRYLWNNAGDSVRVQLHNDGFSYTPSRENFELKNNQALRLTMRHTNQSKAAVAIWWKTAEGIRTASDFAAFRKTVLEAPVSVQDTNGVLDIIVTTASGPLGVKADLKRKQRISYTNPATLPTGFLFNVDGKELGIPLMGKYR